MDDDRDIRRIAGNEMRMRVFNVSIETARLRPPAKFSDQTLYDVVIDLVNPIYSGGPDFIAL